MIVKSLEKPEEVRKGTDKSFWLTERLRWRRRKDWDRIPHLFYPGKWLECIFSRPLKDPFLFSSELLYCMEKVDKDKTRITWKKDNDVRYPFIDNNFPNWIKTLVFLLILVFLIPVSDSMMSFLILNGFEFSLTHLIFLSNLILFNKLSIPSFSQMTRDFL